METHTQNMENRFRFEEIETTKSCVITPKGFTKVFIKTNVNLPLDVDVQNRFAILTKESEEFLDEIYDIEVRKDDIWVITSPKSGTTWTLEMVWLLVNNLDYETALKVDLSERCPYLECITLNRSFNSLETLKNMKSPRIIKTHLPIHVLPKDLWIVRPKIIYVTRDPKDAIVSYRHFFNKIGVTSGSLNEFVNEVVNDRTFYGPVWPQIAEFWSLRNEAHVHFLSYERMKKDLKCEILKVSKFLEKTLSMEEELDKLAEHLTFDKMKNIPSCNNVKQISKVQKVIGVEEKPMGIFLRKGQVGSYKEELNEELIQILDHWIEKSTKSYGISLEEVLYS